MPRIFISDSTAGGTHGATIRSAILANHPGLVLGDITLQLNATYNLPDVLTDMATAFNGGYELFVHSSTLAHSLASQANTYWGQSETMRVVMTLGSNSHVNVPYTPDTRPSAITCGASDGNANETGYGNALWFFDNDNDSDPSDASSFSTGVIAGKLLYIKDQRGGDWQDAIYAAKKTSSLGGIPTLNDGYGIINVADAIAFSEIPMLSGTAVGNSASITIGTTEVGATYYVEKNIGFGWQSFYIGTETAHTDTLSPNLATQYRYRTLWDYEYSDYSNTVTLTYVSTVRASNNYKYAGQTDVTLAELGKTIGEYSDVLGGTNVVVSMPERIAVDIITALKAITEGTTYRNTPQYVGKVALDPLKRTVHPAIFVNIGDSVIRPHDDIASAYFEDIQVNVVGYVKNRTDMQHAGNLSDLLESLVQDCMKALLPQITANINTNRWHINIHKQPITINRTLDIEQNVGEFVITFMATAFALNYEREMWS